MRWSCWLNWHQWLYDVPAEGEPAVRHCSRCGLSQTQIDDIWRPSPGSGHT